MRNFLLATLFVATSSVANAGILSATSEPTPGLEGFETITFSFEAEEGEAFRGFDASFTGTINQLNPFGLETIFNNNNGAVIGSGGQAEQDSQFLFGSSEVLSIGATESGAELSGAISGLAALGLDNPAAFAQIVTNAPVGVAVAVEFDNGAGGVAFGGTAADYLGETIPEPSTCILAGLALVGFAARRNG